MAQKFDTKLVEDLSSMLNEPNNYDVIIRVGEGQNTKEFRVHSQLLRARSPYFKTVLSANWITKEDNMIIFKKPNITPEGFEVILKYLYTGRVNLSERSGENVLELLIASDELLIEELFEHIQDHLIENRTSWIRRNFDIVLYTAFRHVRCKKLQDYCLDPVRRDLITSETFRSLDKDILLDLLERDSLLIDEAVAWDGLIKWGIKQTPDLGIENSDRTKWNVENYKALKETLNEFIPLIRFVQIPRTKFWGKVHPYEAVIPRHIYKEVLSFHCNGVLPKSMILLPRSIIINPNIATTITNWIDGNDSAVLSPNNKFKFNLIYSMSRDGLKNKELYGKRDEKRSLVVFFRVQSKKIYGGYNPTSRDSTKSFIFSFENDQDTHNMRIGRVINSNYNKFEDMNLLNFGGQLYYHKKHLYLSNSGKYHSISNSCAMLPVEEIEVFNVEKYLRQCK